LNVPPAHGSQDLYRRDGRGSHRPVELLDALAARIGDVGVAAAVDRHRPGQLELAVPAAGAAPGGDDVPARSTFWIRRFTVSATRMFPLAFTTTAYGV
jgi:hypothetical protein